jgi:hypothetical protein
MKKNMLKFLLAFTLLAGFSSISHAQSIYVKVQPVDPVVVRPAAPSAAHVWVDGEYVVRGGAYVWQPGYWSLPPRGRRLWVRGHWAEGPRGGYFWKPGHWR